MGGGEGGWGWKNRVENRKKHSQEGCMLNSTEEMGSDVRVKPLQRERTRSNRVVSAGSGWVALAT